MKIIKTQFFQKQVEKLSKDYRKVQLDLDIFYNNLTQEPFSELWMWVKKFRIKNSSIPTWKSWGFRIIAKVYEDKFLPILVYSKTQKENVSSVEVLDWIKSISKEI